MLRLNTSAQLAEAQNQHIEIEGDLRYSKAGVFVIFDNVNIWLHKNVDYDTEQRVLIKGLLKCVQSPLTSFPVAQQDGMGAWSQGVTPPSTLKAKGHSTPILPPTPSFEATPVPSPQQEWLIEVDEIHPLA